ncbi:MAG: CPBP family intramembrane metalloprotease [Clostridiales bacterium]|jgi:membrane protease YdiL (CAAX protease family)|nr:CPBP family intramembrane metalloprotease [Clostridiales bacterium]
MLAEALQYLANSLRHGALCLILPLIWWLAQEGCEESFVKWLGLKRVLVSDPAPYILCCLGLFALMFGAFHALPTFVGAPTAASQFGGAGKGLAAIPDALSYGFIRAGISQEILFRGFLGKRLGEKFSFATGNIIQAAAFGLFHAAGLFRVNFWAAAAQTVLVASIGWLMGFMDEKLSEGSITSSWLINSVYSTVAALRTALVP